MLAIGKSFRVATQTAAATSSTQPREEHRPIPPMPERGSTNVRALVNDASEALPYSIVPVASDVVV